MRAAAWRETLAWAGPLLAAAAGSAVLLLAGAGDSQAASGRPDSPAAAAASTGTGNAAAAATPRTRAEALARHRARLQTCQALTVAAVRAECQRQSARTLALEIAALPAAAASGAASD